MKSKEIRYCGLNVDPICLGEEPHRAQLAARREGS